VYQGSRKCDHDGYSVARRYHTRGSKQTPQGCECPSKEKPTILKSFLVWCYPRGALEPVVRGIVATVEFNSEQVIRMGIVVTFYQVHIQESVLPPLTKEKKRIHDKEIVAIMYHHPYILYLYVFVASCNKHDTLLTLSPLRKLQQFPSHFHMWSDGGPIYKSPEYGTTQTQLCLERYIVFISTLHVYTSK